MNFPFENLASLFLIGAYLAFVVFIVILVGLGTIVFLMFSKKADKHQSERPALMAQLASRMGFTYIEAPPVPDCLKNTEFATQSLMMNGGINHLMQGTINGLTVLIFDFGIIHTIGTINTVRHTVICVPRDIEQPFIYFHENRLIEPENIRAFLDEALRSLNYIR